MSYGSETWPVKEEDMKRLERNDAGIIRWMCGISLNDSLYFRVEKQNAVK